ncbi:hypothetical protein OS175_01210 [Marinicella sp. S1101]|uniref:hypothetical protein n=1 Tax=Marinicella marina TaxID=2996016 RepID=UPI002260B4B5|nr:hypothetical protein [Marinicella marina]MCX7552480.1 hypothetical protein [Marinicella marina]MDJ1139356.1 hypothetical protein [Marinicella marina]
MHKLIKLPLLFFILVLANTATLAFQVDSSEQKYTRILDRDGVKSFQVAMVRYAPRTGGERYVDLVGAVHIADETYYQNLNEMFKNYDAVLYEAIMPEGASIPVGGPTEKSGLSGLQSGIADFMGLSFQMNEVDYSSKHFLHADMTPTEFQQSMENKGESFFGIVFKMMRADYANQLTGNSPINNFDLMKAMMATDRENEFRKILATVLLDMDMLKTLEGSEGSTIISERNNKALKVLSIALQDDGNKSFAIFYGAGHLPDFHEKLIADFDMVPVSTQWLDAWSFQ